MMVVVVVVLLLRLIKVPGSSKRLIAFVLPLLHRHPVIMSTVILSSCHPVVARTDSLVARDPPPPHGWRTAH
ncbi:hypothetical protein BKA80DRAFT_264223 [Phyllosticta citrichinensis]